MQQYDNAMRRQVMSLPELMRQQYEDLEPKTHKVLTTPEIFNIQRIVITGCGDSIAAGMATKHALELLTGIPTEVVTAVELARLYHKKQLGFAPLNPLVIAVSNSGGVARVAEAVQRCNAYGAFTLGITSKPDSILATSATRVLQTAVPAFESAPGVRSYMVAVMALLLIAIRIGEVRGVSSMEDSMAMRKDMLAQAKQLDEMLPEIDGTVLATAEQFKDCGSFDFVGSGFDYATAWYGHAKIIEALGKPSMHINSEEFLHLNFFLRASETTGTVLVANTTNPCHSRNREVSGYMQQLKRPLLVVTDGTAADFEGNVTCVHTPKTAYPMNIPLTQFVPLALLAGYLMVLCGEAHGRGCEGLWSFCKGGAAVKNSEIIVK